MPAQRFPTVLCADDDQGHRFWASDLLGREGHQVREAANGSEALALAREVDLVILDLHLPDIDGFEVCRRIRSDPLTASIPIILLTGVHTHSEDKARGLECGEAFLTKPVDPDELLGQVRALLRITAGGRAARASALSHRQFVESVEDYALIMLDREGYVRTWNAGAERILGYRADEALDLPVSRFYPPEDVVTGLPSELLQRADAQGRVEYEGWRLRKDGSHFWASVVITALRGPDGSVWNYGKIVRDLTAKKRLQEELALTRFAVANCAISHFLIGPDGRFLAANDAACRLLGRPREELLRLRVADIDPACSDEVWGELWERLRREESLVRETAVGRKDATVRWIEVHANYLVYEGQEYACVFAPDVTQRREAAQSLADSQRRFQALFDNALDAYLLADDAAHYVDANPAACQLLGYSRDELLRLSVPDITTPRTSEEGRRVWEDFLSRGNMEGECAVRRKDGAFRQVDFRAVARVLPGLHLSAIRDVTDRKKAEQDLQDREEQLRHILEQVPAILWTTDRELRVTSYTGAGLHNVAYDSQSTFGTSVPEAFPEEPDHQVMRDHKRALAGEEVINEVNWGGRWWAGRLKPLRAGSGQIIGCVGVVLDITARKETEEKLRVSERRLAEAQRAAHIGSWERDLRTDLVVWSAETFALFGKDLCEEPLGPNYHFFLSHVHPDDLARVEGALEEAVRSRAPFAYQYRIRTGQGGERVLEDRGDVIVDEAGEPVRLVGTVQDITDRKRSEAERAAGQQLLEAMSRRLLEVQENERRALARELHDEIGQALTLVSLTLEALRDAGPADRPPRLDECAQLVNETIERVRALSLDLRPASLDALGLEAAVRALVRRIAERASIQAQFTSSLGGRRLPAGVETAGFRIAQEALTNVARHSQAGRVWVELAVRGGELQVVVEDDGRGLDAAAAKERMLRGGCFGLLSMHERAELIGGHLEIDSAAGRGTTVRADLPLSGAVNGPRGGNRHETDSPSAG